MEYKILFSKDIKEVFLQICGGLIGLQKEIEIAGENIDKIYDKAIQDSVVLFLIILVLVKELLERILD